jgi:hypothetical protein
MKDCVGLILQKIKKDRKHKLVTLYKTIQSDFEVYKITIYKTLKYFITNGFDKMRIDFSLTQHWSCANSFASIVRSTSTNPIQIFLDSIKLACIEKTKYRQNDEETILLETETEPKMLITYRNTYNLPPLIPLNPLNATKNSKMEKDPDFIKEKIDYLIHDMDLRFIYYNRESIFLSWEHWKTL